MFEPTATQIPTLFKPGPRWLVQLGPTPAERYYGDAPNEQAAIERAKDEHKRRQAEKE